MLLYDEERLNWVSRDLFGRKALQEKLSNGVYEWSFIPSKYVQEAVRVVKDRLKKSYDGCTLPSLSSAPPPIKYCPELDIYPELDAD